MSLRASSSFKRPLDRYCIRGREAEMGAGVDEARGSMPSSSRASAASTATWNEKKRQFVKNLTDRQTDRQKDRKKDKGQTFS
jgi:hypothetical protein